MKIIHVVKHFRRVVSDGDYGSIASGTELTVEQEINSPEELQELNKKMAQNVRTLTNQDIKEYLALKNEKKVY